MDDVGKYSNTFAGVDQNRYFNAKHVTDNNGKVQTTNECLTFVKALIVSF